MISNKFCICQMMFERIAEILIVCDNQAMKQLDFSAVFLKAKAFREKYTMGYLARPVSRPFCLELAGILERNRELLDSASDIKPGPELAKLAYEWGDKLATGSAACLEVLRNAHDGETFN